MRVLQWAAPTADACTLASVHVHAGRRLNPAALRVPVRSQTSHVKGMLHVGCRSIPPHRHAQVGLVFASLPCVSSSPFRGLPAARALDYKSRGRAHVTTEPKTRAAANSLWALHASPAYVWTDCAQPPHGQRLSRSRVGWRLSHPARPYRMLSNYMPQEDLLRPPPNQVQ